MDNMPSSLTNFLRNHEKMLEQQGKVEPPAVIVIPPEDKRIPALQISIMIDAIKKDLEREHNVYFTERMKQILEQLVCVHNTIMGVK